MKFTLTDLTLETTRRCNIQCEHCMRGYAQRVDLTPEIVDLILDNPEIAKINYIYFSGGEPTLNPKIIIYTIDKIIAQNLNVCAVSMLTNGQVFDIELVEAFNRFNAYRNQKIKEYLANYYFKDELEKIITANMDGHARIIFSVDSYHQPVSLAIKRAYLKASRGLQFSVSYIGQEDVYQTGLATFGQKFQYHLKELGYYEDDIGYTIINNIYVTAKGNIVCDGIGTYEDMDNLNMGHLSEVSLKRVLQKYGKPLEG